MKKTRYKQQGGWRDDMSYDAIKKHKLQHVLDFDDFGDCDSGHCGL